MMHRKVRNMTQTDFQQPQNQFCSQAPNVKTLKLKMMRENGRNRCFEFLCPVLFTVHEKRERYLKNRFNFILIWNRHKIIRNERHKRRNQIIMQ